MRHLLYALTSDRRLQPEPGRLLTAAWHAIVEPVNDPTPPGTPVDDPHAVAARALALAGSLDDITARLGLVIDWQEATIAAAVAPDRLRVWLFKAAQLLAADLWQVLIAGSWEQVTGFADVAVVLTESDHLANLADAVRTATGTRRHMLEHLTANGNQISLLDGPPAHTDRPDAGQ